MSACQAMILGFLPCGEPARATRRACVHEHVRDGLLCDAHRQSVGSGNCLDCATGSSPHDCPISLTDLEPFVAASSSGGQQRDGNDG